MVTRALSLADYRLVVADEPPMHNPLVGTRSRPARAVTRQLLWVLVTVP